MVFTLTDKIFTESTLTKEIKESLKWALETLPKSQNRDRLEKFYQQMTDQPVDLRFVRRDE